MFYTIRHTTRFRYDAPVSESVMEVRMQPRTEAAQRCLLFELQTRPRATVFSYQDFRDNVVHHFNILPPHRRMEITARAVVEMGPIEPLPPALDESAWQALERQSPGTNWEYRHESHFARFTPSLRALAEELGLYGARPDPLTLLKRINSALYDYFDYVPQTTRVDSPLDDVLTTRKGVCQDFTHVMVSLVRGLGIPARYVSGYLFHRTNGADRSAVDATHAWMEAWLPELGWAGFDPTNNLEAGERHIRCAIGRDYADVPPTRGVFTGDATSELEVAVQVLPTDEPPVIEEPIRPSGWAVLGDDEEYAAAQQQQ